MWIYANQGYLYQRINSVFWNHSWRDTPALPVFTSSNMDESNSQTKPAVSLMTIVLSILTRVHRAQLLRLPLQKMAQFIQLKMATTVYKTKGNRCQRVRVESSHSWSLNRGRRSNDHQTGSYTGVAKVPINPCPERIRSVSQLWCTMIRMTIQVIPKHRSLLRSGNNTIARCRLSLFPYNAMALSYS